jgi:hypothetical protein
VEHVSLGVHPEATGRILSRTIQRARTTLLAGHAIKSCRVRCPARVSRVLGVFVRPKTPLGKNRRLELVDGCRRAPNSTNQKWIQRMSNASENADRRPVLEFIAHIFVALLFIGVPLLAIGWWFPGSMPVIFIVAGLLVFCVPGLFYSGPSQPQNLLAAYARCCCQLIQDEDPETSGKISLAKFQMLFWTIILATSFTWLLLNKHEAPSIPNEWLVLMGISNGTYVLAKVAKAFKSGRPQSEPSTTAPGEK